MLDIKAQNKLPFIHPNSVLESFLEIFSIETIKWAFFPELNEKEIENELISIIKSETDKIREEYQNNNTSCVKSIIWRMHALKKQITTCRDIKWEYSLLNRMINTVILVLTNDIRKHVLIETETWKDLKQTFIQKETHANECTEDPKKILDTLDRYADMIAKCAK